MSDTRRNAREWAVQMLTAADLNPPDDVQAFIAQFWDVLGSLDDDQGRASPGKRMREFAAVRVAGVLSTLDELDGDIKPLLENWDLYRLGTIERSVLRLGIWEMKYTDVPKPVVINECVDLANWFSSPRTRKIINGVLDRYAKSMVEEKKVEG